MKKVRAELQRTANTVFVNVANPKAVPSVKAQYAGWQNAGKQMATESGNLPKADTPSPNDEALNSPSIDEVFAESLPLFIEASRWGRYISLGPASRIHDNTTYQYFNPSPNFWDLYELSKGIFRDLGIYLSKQRGTWVANIPIRVLTDKVFIESGLAAVENTLLEHTGIDPVAILREIRERQFRETQDGIRKVKLGKDGIKETIGDAVGAIAIFALSYFGYLVMGGVA